MFREEMSCNNVKEFIEKIISLNHGVEQDRFVYRGVDDANYHLTPKLFRNKKLGIGTEIRNEIRKRIMEMFRETFKTEDPEKIENSLRNSEMGKALRKPYPENARLEELLADPKYFISLQLFVYELLIIEKLRDEAYLHGIQLNILPPRYDWLGQLGRYGAFKVLEENWPTSEDWHLLALGQHYGLHTRFLDWTRQPLIAVYFSASSALENEGNIAEIKNKELCIWAVDRKEMENMKYVGLNQEGTVKTYTEFFEPSGLSNPNAAAQESVFSICRYSDAAAVNELPVGMDEIPAYSNAIRKIKISHRYAAEILKTLSVNFGITAKKIFPSHEGFVRHINESMLY